MKYLVCRRDAIKNGGTSMINSSCFPILVDYDHTKDDPYGDWHSEGIVRKAFDSINQGYVGMHDYVVVPMEQALVVSFRPKTQYEVSVRNF